MGGIEDSLFPHVHGITTAFLLFHLEHVCGHSKHAQEAVPHFFQFRYRLLHVLFLLSFDPGLKLLGNATDSRQIWRIGG